MKLNNSTNQSILDLQEKSIGELKELLPVSKIKDNVDLAGLLVPLQLTKAIKFNSKVNQIVSISASNNLLTAHTSPLMKIMVVEEVMQ